MCGVWGEGGETEMRAGVVVGEELFIFCLLILDIFQKIIQYPLIFF